LPPSSDILHASKTNANAAAKATPIFGGNFVDPQGSQIGLKANRESFLSEIGSNRRSSQLPVPPFIERQSTVQDQNRERTSILSRRSHVSSNRPSIQISRN